jgi:hypothetical protein
MGLTYSLMGNAMEQFRNVINRERVDYAKAAASLMTALEMIGKLEKQLRDAKIAEQFPERN